MAEKFNTTAVELLSDKSSAYSVTQGPFITSKKFFKESGMRRSIDNSMFQTTLLSNDNSIDEMEEFNDEYTRHSADFS